MRNLFVSAAVGLVSFALGFVIGGIGGETHIQNEEIKKDARIIERAIHGRPEFAGLRTDYDTGGFSFVTGTLQSEAAKEELRRLLVEEAGNDWTKRRLEVAVQPVAAVDPSTRAKAGTGAP
jgi:hypothetical protein